MLTNIKPALWGAVASIYAYTAANIYGIYTPAFKKAIAISVAGQQIPYFGRLLYAAIAGFVVWLVFTILARGREEKLDGALNIFLILVIIAIALSFLFP